MNTYEVRAGLAEVEGFTVTGISTVTAQKNAAEEINALWEQLFKDGIGSKVQHKADDVIYAVYSDYEGDHTKPYRVTLGYRVNTVEPQQNLHSVAIAPQEYAVLSAAGEQPKAIVETWTAVWASDLKRSFRTDFEVYGPRFFQDGLNEALIHVGVDK